MEDLPPSSNFAKRANSADSNPLTYENEGRGKKIITDMYNSDDSGDDEPVEHVPRPRLKASPPKKAPLGSLNAYGVPSNLASQKTASKVTLDLADRIRVCVRKRPLSKKEIKNNQVDIANVNGRRNLTINEPK
jgi:hypothetical protein